MRDWGTVLCALVAVIAAVSSPADAQVKKETFDVDTTWQGKPIRLRPEMHIPATPGPHGTILLINSSAGADDVFFGKTPAAFAKLNIITVTLDTFTPRGVGNTIYDQSKVATKDMILDALRVLERLKADPRVKRGRIAVMGHSKGGLATVYLASAGWYGFNEVRYAPNFDAGIALSPDCSLQATGLMEGTFPHYD